MSIFLDIWASGVATQLLSSMSGSDGKQSNLALVPTYFGDFVKLHFFVYCTANVQFEEVEFEEADIDQDDIVEKEDLVP